MGAVTESDVPDPPSAKVVAALLRDARSLSRRADKLDDDAAAVADSMTRQLATEARTSIDSLVRHLMVLERRQHHRENAATRRSRKRPLRPGRQEQRVAATGTVLRPGCGDLGRARCPPSGFSSPRWQSVISCSDCRAVCGLFWSPPATSAGVPGRGSATRSRRWWAPSPVSAGPDRSRARGGHPRAARRRRRGRIHRYVDSSAPDRLRPSVRRNTTSRPLDSLLIRFFGHGSSTGRPAAMSVAS
jgi:hypothetical protein